MTSLALFFLAGAAISGVSSFSLLDPGGFFEPMWRLNPRAREAFAGREGWAVLLLAVVSVACAAGAAGLWRGRPWGHRLAVVLLAVNLLGDIANVVFGKDPRVLVGVPIAGALLVYLFTSRVRDFFRRTVGTPA